MSTNPQIDQMLITWKAQGLSSPAGMYWQRFYDLLRSKKQQEGSGPPVPLILAASGESNGAKQRRLASQLEWAIENGCFEEATIYLNELPACKWNSGSLDKWDRGNY